jgi:hypothetical protein
MIVALKWVSIISKRGLSTVAIGRRKLSFSGRVHFGLRTVTHLPPIESLEEK